ncbi:phytoene/squalene synthase family protein [Salibacterium salarium]|uniref:Phytoene/squalene synthase family protein n=2 Tax=Salibacterium salarium TaxID=284579 RepID=A0A3R9RE45_9BACI|nr:phytoene/squalene synthase family protein [Salibacterium salarium]
MAMLKHTSRTFYIPITFLEPTLKKAVASAYLCMRAIDEIEDHENLDNTTKQHLLRSTSSLLKHPFDNEAYRRLVHPYKDIIPEVSLRLGDWISFCPTGIAPRVKDYTSKMAAGMADWAEKGWDINNKDDLDDYTYYVAGLVGEMLSDIWEWRDGTLTDRSLAVAYGRGLQTVNILRNQQEDLERGVSFIPEDWNTDDMFQYAEDNLALADKYIKDINSRSIVLFCKIPLALAKKTLKALKNGREKMSRTEVESTIEEVQNESL